MGHIVMLSAGRAPRERAQGHRTHIAFIDLISLSIDYDPTQIHRFGR